MTLKFFYLVIPVCLFSMVVRGEGFNNSSMEFSLTVEQRNQLKMLGNIKAENFQKLDADKVLIPRYSSQGGEVILTPQILSTEYNLIKELAVPVDISADSSNGIPFYKLLSQDPMTPDVFGSINLEYFEGENSKYRKFLASMEMSPFSVAPGEIDPIGRTPLALRTRYTEDAILDQVDWGGDPCNESRNMFYEKIESRLDEIFKSFSLADDNVNQLTVRERKELSAIAKRFDEDCLIKYSDLDQNEGISKAIKSRIVVLTEDSIPFCGALRLERTRLITARHCFFNFKTGNALLRARPIIAGRRDHGIEAHILESLESGNRYRIKGFVTEDGLADDLGDEFQVTNDYVIFEIEDSSDLSDPEEFSTLERNAKSLLHEPLMLIGFYVFHNSNWRFQLNGAKPADWRDGLRLTKGNYCRVLDVSANGACIAHGCQTISLFSGGPIVSAEVDDEQKIRMLGVHSRDGGGTSGCEPFQSNLNGTRSAVGRQGGIAVAADWIFD